MGGGAMVQGSQARRIAYQSARRSEIHKLTRCPTLRCNGTSARRQRPQRIGLVPSIHTWLHARLPMVG